MKRIEMVLDVLDSIFCLVEIKWTEGVLEKEGLLCDFYSVSIYVGYICQPWSD